MLYYNKRICESSTKHGDIVERLPIDFYQIQLDIEKFLQEMWKAENTRRDTNDSKRVAVTGPTQLKVKQRGMT